MNGEPRYSWDGKSFGTRPPDPPALGEGDTLLYDEPGRCGGVDSHCHHLRVVENHRTFALLVRHGAGDERIKLGYDRHSGAPIVGLLAAMDSNARYWFLLRLYYVQHDAVQVAVDALNARWRRAVIEKRIKVRKRQGVARVELLPERHGVAQ